MFTDIAGYTKAMSESEQKALEMLRKKRSIIKTLINNYDGQYVKELGDKRIQLAARYDLGLCFFELNMFKRAKIEFDKNEKKM